MLYRVWLDVKQKAYCYFGKIGYIRYLGYLVNHTKQLAICLACYSVKSDDCRTDKLICLDPVPMLTETTGGYVWDCFSGLPIETMKLIGTWCGDLLQIVDSLPRRYVLIDCSFPHDGIVSCDSDDEDEE